MGKEVVVGLLQVLVVAEGRHPLQAVAVPLLLHQVSAGGEAEEEAEEVNKVGEVAARAGFAAVTEAVSVEVDAGDVGEVPQKSLLLAPQQDPTSACRCLMHWSPRLRRNL